MAEARTIPLPDGRRLSDGDALQAARDFHALMQRRRTVRDFDARPVAREVIEHCIAAAGTAPSGANQQPWHFVAVSDPAVKRRIREAAEAEEREFYERRAPDEWLQALRPIGTDWRKPFLETAPWLIAIFVRKWGRDEAGGKVKHYYPAESVGIATGILVTALHTAGRRRATVPVAGRRARRRGREGASDRTQADRGNLELDLRPLQRSAIHLAAMAEPDHHDSDLAVTDVRDHAMVADAVLPEPAELVAFQRCAQRARVIRGGDALPQEPDDPARDGPIEPAQLIRRALG